MGDSTGTGLGEDPPTPSPAPRPEHPDPPSSSLRAPPTETSTDFAAAAAMAQDILSMEVTDEGAPARPETGDLSPVEDTDGGLQRGWPTVRLGESASSPKCPPRSGFLYRITTTEAVPATPLELLVPSLPLPLHIGRCKESLFQTPEVPPDFSHSMSSPMLIVLSVVLHMS